MSLLSLASGTLKSNVNLPVVIKLLLWFEYLCFPLISFNIFLMQTMNNTKAEREECREGDREKGMVCNVPCVAGQ